MRLTTRLELYVAACVLRAFALSAAALVALFSLLEFVDQLGAVGQGHYNLGDALIYALLTIPARLLQITPVATLLGSLLGLGLLSRQFELIVMQSLGLPIVRIMGAVFKLAAPIVIGLFLVAQYLVPPAQALAESWRDGALSAGAPAPGANAFWAQQDGSFISVQRLLPGDIAKNIDIYDFAADGSLICATHAEAAQIEPDGRWRLTSVTQETVAESQFQVRHFSRLDRQDLITPRQAAFLALPPDAMPPLALYNYIGVLERRHQPAMLYRQLLWIKLCLPASMLAMVLIAAALVFRTGRAQSVGQQIMLGGVIGVGFLFMQQIAAYLVLLLDLDPAAAMLAPPAMLAAAALLALRGIRR